MVCGQCSRSPVTDAHYCHEASWNSGCPRIVPVASQPSGWSASSARRRRWWALLAAIFMLALAPQRYDDHGATCGAQLLGRSD